jgi:hypothetical protein
MCLILSFLTIILGLAIEIQGHKALLSPSYKYVYTLAPYWVWALCFMLPGVVTAVLLSTRDRQRAAVPLTFLAAFMVFWAVMLGAGSLAATGVLGVFGIAVWLALAGLSYIGGQAAADL